MGMSTPVRFNGKINSGAVRANKPDRFKRLVNKKSDKKPFKG